MLSRVKKRHIVLLSLLAALGIFSLFYFSNDQKGPAAFIRSYEQDKDFQPLVKLMNDNNYWITENPDFSPERMLLTRAPSSDPTKKGSVNVDVVESERQTAGFIAYYKKGPEQGFIWLLAVDKIFRGRGYGEMLLSNALAKLKKQQATYVTIATRLINKPALSLYRKLGFIEQHREEDRGMITLIKKGL